MKVTLKPGVELDVLTQDELHETMTNLLSGFSRGPNTDRSNPAVELDASGNTFRGSTSGVPVPIFRVPAGYEFALHRLALKPDGYTFGVPYTSSTGYVEIQRNGVMEDGIPLTAPGLPRVFTAGTADAIVFNNNDRIDLLIVGGPASTAVQIALQGTLEPFTVT